MNEIKNRIFLIFSGLCLSFVLVEILLRLGGGLYLVIQDYENRDKFSDRKTYRILCLGDSMTAFGGKRSYPALLKKTLNERQDELHFNVINRGVPAIDSLHINAQIEQLFEQYRPDMVVTMVGINDNPFALTIEQDDVPAVVRFFGSLKVTKVARWLGQSLFPVQKKYPRFEVNNPDKLKKLQKQEARIRKAIENNPRDEELLLDLGVNLREQGKNQSAMDLFKEFVENHPENFSAYFELGDFYKYLGEFHQSAEVLEEAIRLFEPRWVTYVSLGSVYRSLRQYEQSEKILLEGIAKFPKAYWLYVELGFSYRDQLEFKKAKEAFETAIQTAPDHKYFAPYVLLGIYYRKEGRLEEAKAMFKKARQLAPDNRWIQYELRADPSKKIEEDMHNPYTRENYQEVAAKALIHGVQLVAVQYPMLKLERLENMLAPYRKDVIFVDNEETFREAVRVKGYQHYFYDRFGGKFGHATFEGNKLLTENIAKKILAHLF